MVAVTYVTEHVLTARHLGLFLGETLLELRYHRIDVSRHPAIFFSKFGFEWLLLGLSVYRSSASLIWLHQCVTAHVYT
jgi:hypothetical protein